MNENALMEKMLSKLDSSTCKDDYVKKDLSSFEDANNSFSFEMKRPLTLFDIKEKLEELKKLREGVKDKDFGIKDEENEIVSYLKAGIKLDSIPNHEEVMEGISAFLSQYGYDRDSFVFDNLKDMVGNVCPMSLLGIGKAQALRTYIDLDIDFFDYDEEGKVIGVSPSKKDLFKYIVSHEFFHKLSSFKNGHDDVIVLGDALLEGFTDMFAHIVSGNYTDKSDLYDFPVRVCEMFTEMMGMDSVLDDYIKETGRFPKLRNLFSACGLDNEGFMEFRSGLDSVISGVSRDRESGLPKEEWGRDEKNRSLDFLRDNIVIPYCQNNPGKVDSVLSRFNELFQDMGYSCSIEDIKSDKK